uniref:GIY-YIG domain-containing protein n=1 Tax=Orbilia brochopaga TaxID=3140254 RepID=A0A4Y5MXN0_9PEZI|nr:hypothetical protein [Drechslerella brochopaga]
MLKVHLWFYLLKKKNSSKWNVQAVYSISLHLKDKELLQKIKSFFGNAGSITSQSKNSIQYRVTFWADLQNFIIPHFLKYPLLTQKKADFILFKQVLDIINNKDHLSLEGLQKIVNLKASLNKGLSEELKRAYPNTIPTERPQIFDQKIFDPYWLAGFTSGEGCFGLNFFKSTTKLGETVRLKFYISQHNRDEANCMINFIWMNKPNKLTVQQSELENFKAIKVSLNKGLFSDLETTFSILTLIKIPLINNPYPNWLGKFISRDGYLLENTRNSEKYHWKTSYIRLILSQHCRDKFFLKNFILALFIIFYFYLEGFIDNFILLSVLPIKTYENADTKKLQILKENRKKSGVYKWVNNINKKTYIGISVNLSRRLAEYFSLPWLLKNRMLISKALIKYGYSQFSLEILEYCKPKECLEREQHYIDLLKPEYNILKVAGSLLGFKHLEATKIRMKGRKISAETRAKLSVANRGKPSQQKHDKKSQQLWKMKIILCMVKPFQTKHELKCLKLKKVKIT